MVTTTNLVSYWKLDESSTGSSAVTRNDSHGTNHLTDNNTTASATGKINSGADFEATNSEYLSITDASQTGLDITGALSISCWINVESTPGATTYYTILCKGGISVAASDTTIQYDLFYRNDGDIQLQGFIRGTGVNKVVGYVTTLTTATWYHVVLTYEPSTALRLYLNGSEVANNTTSIPASLVDTARPFGIGADQASGTIANYFDGIVDEVAIFSQLLSTTDISDLYNGGAGLAYPFTGAALATPRQRHTLLTLGVG